MASKKVQMRLYNIFDKKTKKQTNTSKIKTAELLNELKSVGDGYRPEYIKFNKRAKKIAKVLVSKGQVSEIPELTEQSKPLADKLTQEGINALKGAASHPPQKGGELIDVMNRQNYFSTIDTKDVSLLWGLGVEHEMQIFHLGKQVKMSPLMAHKKQATLNYEAANILFDSQESTCFISGDMHKSGACCKLHPDGEGNCSYHPTGRLKKQIFGTRDKLTDEELEFLKSIDWEATGRYAEGCKPSAVIVKRTPVLMPELVTSAFTNRTINSIAHEAIFQEEMFIKCQMKNPFTRDKVEQYGPLVTHLCGTLGNIKVPLRPTFVEDEYELEEASWKDYVGSYHITMTLPHTQNITTKQFVQNHIDCANQIQWIEPLLMTAFFSPDPDAVGQGPKPGIEGSYRVGAVGWGNFAGADVRVFGTQGVTRGAMMESTWRKGLDLKGMERLNRCVKTAKPQYKKSVSILTSDFRTFNFEDDEDKCKNLYNPNDCPKADGAPMSPPFGMEIRIFDHFHSEYLIDLLKIITLLAANADRHPAPNYVYKSKSWIGAMQAIMTYGWNAQLTGEYVAVLRKQLGLTLDCKSRIARDIFVALVAELHELNKDSLLVGLMDETAQIAPRVPDVNRQCWELVFHNEYLNTLMKHINTHSTRKIYTLSAFKELIFGNMSPFSQERWRHQVDDICYALESKNKVKLSISNGKVTKVTLL
jgi:hypothetical protein